MDAKMNALFTVLTLVIYSQVFGQFQDQSQYLNINSSVATTYNGNGLSFYDFNQDGIDDITIARGNLEPVFLINDGVNLVPAPFSIPNVDSKQIMMIMWVDYDNDGDLDVFITKMFGPVELWKNDGSFNFTLSTAAAGLSLLERYHTGAAFCDYDHDGDLDLYVAKFYHPNIGISPTNASVFYLNDGDGTFTEFTVQAGIFVPQRPIFQPVFLDYNNDGWEDLYLITDRIFVVNELFLNNKDGTFTNVTQQSGAGLMICSMSGTVGDYDNDNDLDVFITNNPAVGSKLLENNGDSTFTEVASQMGVNIHQVGWGALWLDYDNDSWQDLFVSFTGGHPGYIGNHLHKNNEGVDFTNVSYEMGILNEVTETFVCAMGDINNDGYYDILLNPKEGYVPKLYKSITGANHYLSVSLQGVESNKQGVGTWIRAYAGGNEYVRFTLCGENLIGQNSSKYIFGLGQLDVVDSLVVDWNMGTHDVYYNVAVNQHMNIVEGLSFYSNMYPQLSQLYLCPGQSVTLSLPDLENVTWSNGESGAETQVTEPGWYWASITTSSGHTTQTQHVLVEFAPEVPIDVIFSNESCYGFNDGSIELVCPENTIQSVEWATGDTLNIISSLAPGAYTFELTDVHGCVHWGGAFIEPAQQIITLVNTTPALCFGDSTGTAQIIIFGGAFPHVIDWQGHEAQSLVAGAYSVVVIDANGCEVITSYTVGEPEILSAEIDAEDVGISGPAGSASVVASGGTPPYYYEWSSGIANGNQVSGLPVGIHLLTVTDDNACSFTIEFQILDVTGIFDTAARSCFVFPNPVVDKLIISNCNLPPIFSYSIYDITGSLKAYESVHYLPDGISVQWLQPGIYSLRIHKDDALGNVTFVKSDY